MVHKIIILIWIHFIADFLLQPEGNERHVTASKAIGWDKGM